MLYYKGHKILGVNFLPRYTLAQYTALSVKPHYWIRTDAPFRYSGVITTLDDLSDVEISNPIDKQVLTYNATSQKWENKDARGGMLPQIVASTDTGSTVVATKGGTIIPLTETSTGVFECVLYNGSDTYGEWTLTATLNGETETTTVDVDTVKIYNVSFAPPIPDGSTVLPTDDIEILLNCANIWDSPITTLSELLADSTTLEAVINSNNAIDYLVRSTSFASENPLVPKMTSNTTPSGECIASSNASNQEKYKAFDDDTSTQWSANNVNYDGSNYIGYNFGSTKKVAKAIFTPRYLPNYTPAVVASVKYQGSNDGTNWTDVSSAVSIQITTLDTQTPVETLFNNANYQYYRAVFLSRISGNTEVYPTCAELQFYENAEEGFTDNATAMTLIGANNYASNTLLGNSTWLNAICNSTYFESVLNVKVPTMTSATTPEGVVTAIGSQSGYEAYKAFDNNTSTSWYIGSQSSTPWIQYQFTSAKRIYKAVVDVPASSAGKTFTVQFFGSNDGTTFTELSSAYSYPTSNNGIHEDILEGTSYQYLRCNCKRNDANAGSVEKLQFYGRVDV